MTSKPFVARVANSNGSLHEFASTSSADDAEWQALAWAQGERDAQTRENWNENRKNDPWVIERLVDGEWQPSKDIQL